MNRLPWRICICLILCGGLTFAHSDLANRQPLIASEADRTGQPSFFEQLWQFALLQFFPLTPLNAAELQGLTELPDIVPACWVEPLPEIGDAGSLAFETGLDASGAVDVDGLTPRTARALERFEQVVTSVGGIFVLTSAYRPAPYQEHLQAVWDKWMVELRDNEEEACQSLRTEVQGEFLRHQLLESQRPAPFSDHTRGLAFDATVALPRRARFRRRRATIDSLARHSGIHRPHAARDRVHFRLRG